MRKGSSPSAAPAPRNSACSRRQSSSVSSHMAWKRSDCTRKRPPVRDTTTVASAPHAYRTLSTLALAVDVRLALCATMSSNSAVSCGGARFVSRTSLYADSLMGGTSSAKSARGRRKDANTARGSPLLVS